MNRTLVFLVTAAALALMALVVKVPAAHTPEPIPPVEKPVPLATPSPVPVVPAPPPTPSAHPGSLTLSGKLSRPYVAPGTTDVFASLEVSAGRCARSRSALR